MRPRPAVLVVDDYSDGREMLAEYLTFRGCRVFEAKGGEEAIAMAKAMKPDIVLMDLRMPGTDGWEATRRLKADPATRAIVVIAVTAHALAYERESATKAGCDAVVAKPYDLKGLFEALSDVKALGVKKAFPIRKRRRPRRRDS